MRTPRLTAALFKHFKAEPAAAQAPVHGLLLERGPEKPVKFSFGDVIALA